MAVEAASFKIVILSISAGFNCPASEPTITPSITHSGEVVPLSVACPRITTAPLEPGWPDPGATYTPGTLPFNKFSTDGVVMSFNFSLLMLFIEPVKLSLR